jgi:hypothetical protein
MATKKLRQRIILTNECVLKVVCEKGETHKEVLMYRKTLRQSGPAYPIYI